jgi:hypothetical protein
MKCEFELARTRTDKAACDWRKMEWRINLQSVSALSPIISHPTARLHIRRAGECPDSAQTDVLDQNRDELPLSVCARAHRTSVSR